MRPGHRYAIVLHESGKTDRMELGNGRLGGGEPGRLLSGRISARCDQASYYVYPFYQ